MGEGVSIRALLLALSALAGSSLAAGSPGLDRLQLPLRVHVLESTERPLDASRVVDEAVVRERLREINAIFAPAGIEWVLQGVVTERPASDETFRRALTGGEKPAPALKALVRSTTRLSPSGFDLYVTRDLSDLKIGGAYLCTTDGGRGTGAAFIAAENGKGQPLAVRKWAHELGHALGLRHTPCEGRYAGRLMMSGRCQHAEPKRVALTDEEIARARKQALTGGPAPCGAQRDDDAD